jgi:hypothetical protein
MTPDQPIHLINSLGILTNFSIAKKIDKKEISKESRKLKNIYKESDPKKFQKLLMDALVEKTRMSLENETPPGLIFPKKHPKKVQLDKFYMELSAISQALSNKFVEEKFSKHQICFILNAVINILEITEEDFVKFYERFQKYKDGDFSEDGE